MDHPDPGREVPCEARLRQRGTATKQLSREQIHYIVTTLTDITQVIRDADPRDKAEIYSQLGLRLTYHRKAAVLVEARPGPVCTRFVSEDRLEPTPTLSVAADLPVPP